MLSLWRKRRGSQGGRLESLVANPQQVFPLAEIAPEAHAFGNLEGGNQAPLDLLAGLSSAFAS